MIKDIKNVEIQGGFFSEFAKFEIFRNKNDRISIIYGKMEVEKVLLLKL